MEGNQPQPQPVGPAPSGTISAADQSVAPEPLAPHEVPKKKSKTGWVFGLLILGLLLLVSYLYYQNYQLRKEVGKLEVIAPTGTPTTIPTNTCEYNSETYKLGDTFRAIDGCNSCRCEEGGQVSCTEMGCSIEDDPTAGWEVYSNQTHGFEFSYPLDWSYKEVTWQGGSNETSMDFDGVTLRPQESSRGNVIINMYKIKNNGMGTRDYFNKNDYSCCGMDVEPTYLGDSILKSETVSVNSVSGWKLTNAPEDIPIEGVTADWIVVEKDEDIFVFSIIKDTYETMIDAESVFDQILSTFEFTE